MLWDQDSLRQDSYIVWKSSNNTYLNIIKMFTKLLKKIEHHQIANFDKNIDFCNILILFNISMMLNKCIIQWLLVDVTKKALFICYILFFHLFPLFKLPHFSWSAFCLTLLVCFPLFHFFLQMPVFSSCLFCARILSLFFS